MEDTMDPMAALALFHMTAWITASTHVTGPIMLAAHAQ